MPSDPRPGSSPAHLSVVRPKSASQHDLPPLSLEEQIAQLHAKFQDLASTTMGKVETLEGNVGQLVTLTNKIGTEAMSWPTRHEQMVGLVKGVEAKCTLACNTASEALKEARSANAETHKLAQAVLEQMGVDTKQDAGIAQAKDGAAQAKDGVARVALRVKKVEAEHQTMLQRVGHLMRPAPAFTAALFLIKLGEAALEQIRHSGH